MLAVCRTLPLRLTACLAVVLGPAHGETAEQVACRVEMRGGVPSFVVHGRPHSGVCYSTYDCTPDRLSRRAGQFAAAGCEIFNFVVEISGYGYSRPMWPSRDRWDFSELDQRARTVLAAAPHALLLPRIYIDAPGWWIQENPGERMILGNGAASFGEKLFALPRAGDYASLASEKWRADMKRALETVLDHIDRSDYGHRVIGYQLSGQKTEEWYHWSMNTELLGDYSPPMTQAFRRWLRTRYGTDESLRKAWARPAASIDSAPIPSQAERFGDRSKTFRDPLAERQVIDFHGFWSDVMADTIAEFARTIKTKTRGSKVVGAFYGYTFEFGPLAEDAGHLALGRLLGSADVDFVMAPSSYFNRNLPGTPYFRAPVASFNLRGKVFWNDFDQVSYKYFEKLRTDPALKQWEYQMGLTRTAEEFVWMNRREVGMELAQGVQVAHFDIHGGYYEDPVIMAGVKDLIALRNRAMAWKDRTSQAEILVVVDEESEHYLSFRNPVSTTLLSAQLAALGFVAPYDALLLPDLEQADTSRYRLVLVLNAIRLEPDQRALLRRKLACGGKTVLWFHAPGYLSTAGIRAAGMEEATGMRIVPDTGSPRQGTARLVGKQTDAKLELPLLAGDAFCVSDPQAETLAVRADRPDRAVMARKRLGDSVAVYSAAAPLPAVLLRRLAVEAGVHLYTNRSDCLVFANRRCLTLAAGESGGTCQVALPAKRTVVDFATGAEVCRESATFSVGLRPKEVRIFLTE